MKDFQYALDKIHEAQAAARICTGDRLLDLHEAAKHCDLNYYQLYRSIRAGRLKAYPHSGSLGELNAKYLVRLSDVKRLQRAKRGPVPKSV